MFAACGWVCSLTWVGKGVDGVLRQDVAELPDDAPVVCGEEDFLGFGPAQSNCLCVLLEWHKRYLESFVSAANVHPDKIIFLEVHSLQRIFCLLPDPEIWFPDVRNSFFQYLESFLWLRGPLNHFEQLIFRRHVRDKQTLFILVRFLTECIAVLRRNHCIHLYTFNDGALPTGEQVHKSTEAAREHELLCKD